MDGLVKEVGKEQVLQVVVLAVCGRDVLEEDGADDAATAPHEGDGWLIKLPLVFAGSLSMLERSILKGGNVCIPLA